MSPKYGFLYRLAFAPAPLVTALDGVAHRDGTGHALAA